MLSVAWSRFRTTFRQRWGSHLALVLLLGLVGGLALGAVAGARRTQSSYPAFLARTNASALGGVTTVLDPTSGAGSGYDPATVAAIDHLPHVTHVQSYVGLNILPLGKGGAPLDPAPAPGNGRGSVDGLNFDMDRVTVTHGRMADPARADEFVLDGPDAAALGLHVGDVVPIAAYTNAQAAQPGFGTAGFAPHSTTKVTLVGIVVLNRTLVQDDVDAGFSLVDGLFTPAFTRGLLGCCVNYTFTGVQVDAPGDAAEVRAAVDEVLPPGLPAFQDLSLSTAQAERAIKPEALALGVFGAIAALAALVISAQVVRRQLLVAGDDDATLRALGADPRTIAAADLLGPIGGVLVGSLLAVVVGVALSPLAPIGPVRRVMPDPSVAFDATVLGLGFCLFVVALTAFGAVIARHDAPHRRARRSHIAARRPSPAAAALSSRLSPSATVGVRFALEPGAGRAAVPTRSTVLGAALAMVVVTASLTFGASLQALVSHPALYGWSWDYELTAGGGGGDIPQQAVTDALNTDPDVLAWTGVYFSTLKIDGRTVPVLGTDPGASVRPPVLSGHGFDAPGEVVLGPTTLSLLGKHVGDRVDVTDGQAAPTRLQIVGTSTLPAIGTASLAHLEMGTGAVLAYPLIPASARNTFGDPITGPNAVLVRLRSNIDRPSALASLQRIAEGVSNSANFGVSVAAVQRPAEIVNYRSTAGTPKLLGAGLAVGAVAALALTLVASVRRRRRELAVLKVLGFTRRQLAAAVAWQSTVVVAIGTLVGVPLGIAFGRQLWVQFAHGIHAVPSPRVPAMAVLLVSLGGLIVANVVAGVPGRVAARTQAARVFRTDV